MSWTYVSTSISTDTTAQVRMLIGDTSSSAPCTLIDEEISWVTGTYGNIHRAAYECCLSLAGKYSRYVDTNNTGLSVSGSQRSEQYAKRANELYLRSLGGATIFVGGRSKATKETRAEDSDFVQPAFSRGQDDYPGSAGSVYSSTST